MMDGARRVTVDIEPGSDPIRGHIEDEEGSRAFEGWLQLARALEQASALSADEPEIPASGDGNPV
jgi:hypothetical protein